MRGLRYHTVAAVLAMALAVAACGNGEPAVTTDGEDLVGVFGIAQGECTDAGVTSGSYFRMVEPGGTVEDGPFVGNGDSGCGDQSYTPLQAGTDGGFLSGDYQPHPDPAFDDAGNGTAAALTTPQRWFAVAFSLATNPTDPQTGTEVPAPILRNEGGTLSGDLRAFAAAWNGQHFNQGAPKPDGSSPGNTSGPTGAYNPATGAYTLDWTSQIVGGPFDNFTGVWHLEGTFEPSG